MSFFLDCCVEKTELFSHSFTTDSQRIMMSMLFRFERIKCLTPFKDQASTRKEILETLESDA